MRSTLVSILFSMSLVSLTFAVFACGSSAPPPRTPAPTDTTSTTSGSWDSPNLGPSQSSDAWSNPIGVDAGAP